MSACVVCGGGRMGDNGHVAVHSAVHAWVGDQTWAMSSLSVDMCHGTWDISDMSTCQVSTVGSHQDKHMNYI